MSADNLDLPAGKISEAVQRVIDRAALESRRRGHANLTADHLFLALAQVEWNLFADVMRAVDVNPQAIVLEVEEALTALPSVEGVDVRVAPGDPAGAGSPVSPRARQLRDAAGRGRRRQDRDRGRTRATAGVRAGPGARSAARLLIGAHYLATVTAALARAGKTIEIDEEALARLATEGYSAAYGARFLKRVIDERVKLPISLHWHDAPHFHVRAEGDEVVVEPVSLTLVHGEAAVA